MCPGIELALREATSARASCPPEIDGCPSAMASCPPAMDGCPSAMASCPPAMRSYPSAMRSYPSAMRSCPSAMGSCPPEMGSCPSAMASCPPEIDGCPSAMGRARFLKGSGTFRTSSVRLAQRNVGARVCVSRQGPRGFADLRGGPTPTIVPATHEPALLRLPRAPLPLLLPRCRRARAERDLLRYTSSSATGTPDGGTSPGASDAGGGSDATVSGGGTPLPCDVNAVVVAKCQLCHANPPINGAPMPLVTWEDFQATTPPDTVGPSFPAGQPVYKTAESRIHGKTLPMPQPPTTLTQAEQTTLDTWLNAGAPKDDGSGTCAADGGVPRLLRSTARRTTSRSPPPRPGRCRRPT